MLEAVDRVQLAVRDPEAATRAWAELVGAEPVRDDSVETLRARRRVLRVGATELELLTPAGPGRVAEFLDAWGDGLFAAGFAVADVSAMRDQLARCGVRWTEEGEQIHLDGTETGGLAAVLSPRRKLAPAGLLSGFYEVTHLVQDKEKAKSEHARLFGLDPARFSPIESETYGYSGYLLLFDPPAKLDRIEICQITDPARPMGRFFGRRGETLYMSYSECPDTGALVERLRSRGARYVAPEGEEAPANLFIPPSELSGLLLGVSRTNHAWTWSGRPELASPPPAH